MTIYYVALGIGILTGIGGQMRDVGVQYRGREQPPPLAASHRDRIQDARCLKGWALAG